MKWGKNLVIKIFGFCYYIFIKTLLTTVKLHIVNKPDRDVFDGGKVYFVCWHGTLIASAMALKTIFISSKKPLVIICADNFGGRVVGFAFDLFPELEIVYLELDSITKSFKRILSILNENKCVAMTADGPKAPAYLIRKGALALMKRYPSIQMSVKYSVSFPIFWRWDTMRVPLPFFPLTVSFSAPAMTEDEEQVKYALSA